MAQLPLSLKGRALRLLSSREYARQELARKLAPFEEAPGSLAVVLDELQAKGFICEQRVLESVIHRRATKLGAARIQQELQAKGIDTEQIALAVAGLRSTELMRAHAIWQKKFGAATSDARSRAQQARFLASRGFDGDTIRRVLSLDEGDLTSPASI